MIDDDKPGIIGFEKRTMLVHPDEGYAKIKIHRLSGCDGEVKVTFETATPGQIKAAAIPHKDYAPVQGQVTFSAGETEKEIFIKILTNESKTEKDDIF